MKKTASLIAISLIFASAVFAQTLKVTVNIDFGGNKPNESFQAEWYEGMTAMTALQSGADVASHPIKTYIFVNTINGVKTERGAKAWYYEVNGKSTGRIAFRYTVNPSDTITWIYKKDVCSNTVDKKCEK